MNMMKFIGFSFPGRAVAPGLFFNEPVALSSGGRKKKCSNDKKVGKTTRERNKQPESDIGAQRLFVRGSIG
jgi:hypothetical protein